MKLIDLLVKELPKSGGWPKDAVNAIYFSHKKGVTFYDKDGMGIKNGVSFICMDINGVRREEVTKEEFEAAIDKNDGWIDWAGGECPVAGGTLVNVKQRDNWVSECCMPDDWSWKHHGLSVDIIAYRLHKPDINSRANDDRLEQDLDECIGQGVDMTEWSGEGLPPVGVKCEVRVGRDNYEECMVLYSGEHGCAFTYLGDNGEKHSIDCVSKHAAHHYFRPLRTEAEKARELGVSEMLKLMCGPQEYNYREICEIIYDAGYRKEAK